MTQLLEKAIATASQLPDEEQNAIAALIPKGIESEERWDKAFAESQDALASLADEALAEHRAGKTTRLNPMEMK